MVGVNAIERVRRFLLPAVVLYSPRMYAEV